MKSGYLYVLVHPSDPDLYKVGQTNLHPKERLVQHNSNYEKYAGQIVKETGQKWQLKTFIAVPDPYWAERVFWETVSLFITPTIRRGVEIQKMEWELLQEGLDAAKKAGVQPPPDPLPDYVYAYTAWMKKRLQGRDITVLGLVKSKSGKSKFKCNNGHEWRGGARKVAEGEGCPQCGIGERTPEEVRRVVNPSIFCLLIHPDKPGFIRIGLTYSTIEQCITKGFWDEWKIHRFRRIEETALAESLIWELLGHLPPKYLESIEMNLSVAEQAFRDLVPRLNYEIAVREKENE